MKIDNDLCPTLHGGEVDEMELRVLIQDHCGGGVLHVSDKRVVYYGTGREEDAALEVYHDGSDRICAIKPGRGLKSDELETLKRRIEDELIASAGTLTGREILLSEKPFTGFFRFPGRFQILPAPPEAPRPGLQPGHSARHPFLAEVQINASSNPMVNAFRRVRAVDEVGVVLSALLDGSICSGRLGRYVWTTAISPSPETATSLFRREGYVHTGLVAETERFSQTENLDPLPGVRPIDYYAHETFTPASTLALPSNLRDLLGRYYALTADRRAMWLIACYWFRHSRTAQHASFSAAFLALVTAIEALMPRQDRAKNRAFETFVDNLCPNNGPPIDRRSFYRMRSEVAHGAHLLRDDRELTVGLTPEMAQGWARFTEMRVVARNVLVNWLQKQPAFDPPRGAIL